MKEYPKIFTLYDRDEKTGHIIPDKIRLLEKEDYFSAVKCWTVTEKIDGTGLRIALQSDGNLFIGGRTDKAQLQAALIPYLYQAFTIDKFKKCFEWWEEQKTDIILFCEGYGEKIQKGGGDYRSGVAVRLFDVLVGETWLSVENIIDIAAKFGIGEVPLIEKISELPKTKEDLLSIINESRICEQGGRPRQAEGIVAKSSPLMLSRCGNRMIWKLKFKDFQ
jgi:hypothetical protein